MHFSFVFLLLQHPPQQLCGSAPKTSVSIGGPRVLLFTEHFFVFVVAAFAATTLWRHIKSSRLNWWP